MKSCLLVDDSRVVRKVERQIFAAIDFECDEAENGEAALESCRKKLPDLIMIEWLLKGMDGLQFLKSLRSLPGGDKPTVVFCSADNNLDHIRQALEAGANEYIMKPFDADIIRGKLFYLGLWEA